MFSPAHVGVDDWPHSVRKRQKTTHDALQDGKHVANLRRIIERQLPHRPKATCFRPLRQRALAGGIEQVGGPAGKGDSSGESAAIDRRAPPWATAIDQRLDFGVGESAFEIPQQCRFARIVEHRLSMHCSEHDEQIATRMRQRDATT